MSNVDIRAVQILTLIQLSLPPVSKSRLPLWKVKQEDNVLPW